MNFNTSLAWKSFALWETNYYSFFKIVLLILVLFRYIVGFLFVSILLDVCHKWAWSQIFSTSSVSVQFRKHEDYIIIIKWIKMLFHYFFVCFRYGSSVPLSLAEHGWNNLALVLWVDFLVSLFQFMHFIFICDYSYC